MTALASAESPDIAYYTYVPRPDQPERFDQQESFYYSQHRGVSFLVGGNGCLGAEQEIYDPVLQRSLRVDEIADQFHVYAFDQVTNSVKIAVASKPFIKGMCDLYRVKLSDGQSFVCTLDHRVLVAGGIWRTIRELAVGDVLLPGPSSGGGFDEACDQSVLSHRSRFHMSSVRSGQQFAEGSDHLQSAIAGSGLGPTSLQSEMSSFEPLSGYDWSLRVDVPLRHAHSVICGVQGFRCDCPTCYRSCGEQLHHAPGNGQCAFPLPADVQGRIRSFWHSDGRSPSIQHTHRHQPCVHLSRNHSAPWEHRDREAQFHFSSLSCSQPFDAGDILFQDAQSNRLATCPKQEHQRSPEETSQTHTTASSAQLAMDKASSSVTPLLGGNGCGSVRTIASIDYVRTDVFYDLHVPVYNNYLSAGVWHHNSGTTSTCMAKIAKFVFETPPPRKDTPFWVIAGSYEQVMEACWKEKLSETDGHGHIPNSEVDFERIRWFKSNEGWPYRVPLKPWPGRPGRNWVLEFKSYEQGRAQMQARSIGGFCFVEQFPWVLLKEVNRGCREYNFPGSKFCEFTPIDPDLSYALQEMIENDALPKGWHVYRANTQCAMEARHVSAEWFEEFFGMLSDDELQTRLTGAWSSFEGLIYQEFNPEIHFVTLEQTLPDGDFPPNVFHRRGFDWGAGPENPFACVFAYKNGWGEYWFYDEYYSNSQKMTMVDHMAEVCNMWPWPQQNPHYGMTYADPAGRDFIKAASMFSQYKEGYQNIAIQSANNAVYPGIQHVKHLLKVNPATGRPRIFICKERCPNLAREIQIYRWLKGSANSINPQSARAEPLKKDDHAIDALRYLIFTEASRKGETVESFAHNHSRRSIPGVSRRNRR